VVFATGKMDILLSLFLVDVAATFLGGRDPLIFLLLAQLVRF